jgi:hypothetical protein
MSDIIGIDDSPHVKSADYGVFNKNQIKNYETSLLGVCTSIKFGFISCFNFKIHFINKQK